MNRKYESLAAVYGVLVKMNLIRQLKCWSLRCSWSIACRRCSNYIFILDLTPVFNGLSRENGKTRRESFKFLGFGATFITDFAVCFSRIMCHIIRLQK